MVGEEEERSTSDLVVSPGPPDPVRSSDSDMSYDPLSSVDLDSVAPPESVSWPDLPMFP